MDIAYKFRKIYKLGSVLKLLPSSRNVNDSTTSFDKDPQLYDSARPNYPTVLLRAIQNYAKLEAPSRICELGPGTGQASTFFLNQGHQLVAIEKGAQLTDFLKKKFVKENNFSVINQSFEKWHPSSTNFDLVLAAQSFHWLDKNIRWPKTLSILKPQGSLALIWNIPQFCNSPFQIEQLKLYKDNGLTLFYCTQFIYDYIKILKGMPNVTKVRLFTKSWIKKYSKEEYINLRKTITLDNSLGLHQQKLLHAKFSELIDRHGGYVESQYRTYCIVAEKC